MDMKYFVFAAIIGIVTAQSTPSAEDIVKNLPPELQGTVDEGQIEELKNKSTMMIREKCEKYGGPGAYDRLENEIKELPNCMKASLNLTSIEDLKQEIEEAKPHGGVDEVFKKYCVKTPNVKECYNSSLEAAKECLSEEEKSNAKIIYNVTEQLIDFICYKDGDRIALFIAEGGPECYGEKKDEVQDCVNQTFGINYKFDATNITIPELRFGEKECKQMDELQICVVKALESCKTPTSANIVESLFKFIRKATPCKVEFLFYQRIYRMAEELTFIRREEGKSDVPVRRTNTNENKPGAASGLVVTSATILMSLVAAFVF